MLEPAGLADTISSTARGSHLVFLASAIFDYHLEFALNVYSGVTNKQLEALPLAPTGQKAQS